MKNKKIIAAIVLIIGISTIYSLGNSNSSYNHSPMNNKTSFSNSGLITETSYLIVNLQNLDEYLFSEYANSGFRMNKIQLCAYNF